MWQYSQTPDSNEIAHSLFGQRKNHKYIAKIGSGPNAKYFYTQAELAAYKAGRTIGNGAKAVVKGVAKDYGKALSSKDEARELENYKSQYELSKTARDKMIAKTKDSKITDKQRKIWAKGIADMDLDVAKNRTKVKVAEHNYKYAKTLGGKVKDIASTFAKRNPNLVSAVKDYGKAISSKDEKAAYNKTSKQYTSDKANFDKYDKKYKSINNGTYKGKVNNDDLLMADAWKDIRGEGKTIVTKSKQKNDSAKAAYKKSRTISGKAEAVVETFKKRHGKKKVKKC